MAVEQEKIWRMFDRIAAHYDKANRVLSWGQDQYWRSILADRLPKDKPLAVLDIATGTADLLLNMCELRPNIKQAIGIDLSENMLDYGRQKVAKTKYQITLKTGDATNLDFSDNSFDVVSIAFGIRNVVDFKQALKEIARVVKPDGQALILEFSLPANVMIKYGYLAYFRHILPLIGGIISKDRDAYRYLNRTVESFPYAKAFSDLLIKAGFSSIKEQQLCCGIAMLYEARVNA